MTALKKALLIVNPVAGKMKAKTTLLGVVSELQKGGMTVTVSLTAERGHAVRLAENAKTEGYDIVICFGGDGTLNETISGLQKSGAEIPLGYIPAGSTNDFATSMKLYNTPSKAAAAISSGKEFDIDIGCFGGDRYFTYIAAFGIFTAASYSVPQDIKNVLGHVAYLLQGVKEIGNIRSHHVKIESDKGVIEDDFLFGSISNSTSVAGIVKLKSDLVDISDGLFEIGLIPVPKTVAELNKIITSLTTSNFSNGGMLFYKASKVTVSCDEPLDWTLDGEHATSNGSVVIENLNKAIKLIK